MTDPQGWREDKHVVGRLHFRTCTLPSIGPGSKESESKVQTSKIKAPACFDCGSELLGSFGLISVLDTNAQQISPMVRVLS